MFSNKMNSVNFDERRGGRGGKGEKRKRGGEEERGKEGGRTREVREL